MGIKERIIELIMFFVTLAFLSILWNGEKLDSFQPERRLRQGDHLSLYLFVLYGGTQAEDKKIGLNTGVEAD